MKPPSDLTIEHTPAELAAMIEMMRATSSTFYRAAIVIGNHPFIEFCGFMNKYIDLCERAAAEGRDFTLASIHGGQPLAMQPWDADYIGEKFECIFGTSLKGEALDAFLPRAFDPLELAKSFLRARSRGEAALEAKDK